jgi:hypothetical protein
MTKKIHFNNKEVDKLYINSLLEKCKSFELSHIEKNRV